MAAGVFELVNGKGRKYVTGDERDRFIAAARADTRPAVQTFAATLAHTGARISEVLAIRAGDVDVESRGRRIAILKLRREHWRSVPVPDPRPASTTLSSCTGSGAPRAALAAAARGSGPSRGRPPSATSPS